MDAPVSSPEPARDPAPPKPEARKAGVGATIVKNSAWLLIDNVAALLTSFYCSILVARRLGPDRMGEYNYVLWFAFLLKMISDLSIAATFRKFAAEFMGSGDYGTVKTMVRRTQRLQGMLAAIGVTAGLLIVQFGFRADQKNLASLAVLTVAPSLLLSVPAGVLYGTENLRYNVIASLLAMVVNIVGVTVAVVMQLGLEVIVLALLVSRVVDWLVRFTMMKKKLAELPGEPADRLDPALRRRLVQFAALQLVPTLLYALLFDRTEVFFIQRMAPAREIAFFSISFTLVQYLLMAPQTLAGAASVTIMVKQGKAPAEAARIAASATWLTILFGAPELFGVAALSDPLLRLLYGAKYLPAIPVLTVLAFFALGLAASQSAQFLLVAAERQIFYVSWLLVGGIVDVVGCLLLIPTHGALGAAYAKGISQLVAAAGFLGFMILKFHVKLPVVRIVKLLAICTAMYLGVRVIAQHTPPLLALLLGIPVGVAIFGILMRLLRTLDRTDRDRLGVVASMLPGRIRRPYRAIVDFIIPSGTVEPPPPSIART